MNISQLIQLIEIMIWPVVVLVAIFVLRPQLANLFSGSRVTLKFGVLSVETTLPELRKALLEGIGERLGLKQEQFLTSIPTQGKTFPSGGWSESDYKEVLRPLRNAGLIRTHPTNKLLSHADSIKISKLVDLYLRALRRFEKVT